jgi:ABC-type lipoprotein release transport system permease subunit
MVLKNLWRRKGRTILTLVSIAMGVAAIVALGAAAQGLRAGFTSMTRGSQADLVLSQAGAMSTIISSVDEAAGDEMLTWSEVADVDGVLVTNALLDDSSFLFVFGYDPQGFSIEHFRIVEGHGLAEARGVRGKAMLLGSNVAQNLDLQVGDTLRVTGSAFRIVGIYETGDGFEDSGAVVALEEAQLLALQPRRVSMLYVKLRDPADAERLEAQIERRFPDLTISTTSGFADQEQMLAILDGAAMGIAGLAVLIGGLGMTNTLFMSVFERTREIGLLRAVGWRRQQVLLLILGESLALALLGGMIGVGLGVLATVALSRSGSIVSAFGSSLTPDLFVRAFVVVTTLGAVGGIYPARWASRLLPLEALRYEGGSEAQSVRPVPGGMTTRNLLRRRTRTLLTLLGIGVSISAVVALGGITGGVLDTFTAMMRDGQADLLAMEANIDSDFSAIEERVGAHISARPDVAAVSGMIMTAASSDEMPLLFLIAYHPREFAIRRFRIIEGEPLTGRHQVIVGSRAAEQMGTDVGDTLRLLESSFRVVGIYETGLALEDIGVVIGLREAQALTGKPHQVMYYAISLRDPDQAEAVQAQLTAEFPEIDFAFTSNLAESMSDFRVMQEMVGQISFLAVLIGMVGMLNTMLMSVLERTREIGVLRALGWRRQQVLGMILRESLLLGVIGGLVGIGLGVAMASGLAAIPGIFGALEPLYSAQLFVQALVVALVAGVLGGLYPAWRATRMRPVEALRYE